jgi:hypothetical protein
VTAYVPPDPPEAVVFAGDGQGISQWGGFLDCRAPGARALTPVPDDGSTGVDRAIAVAELDGPEVALAAADRLEDKNGNAQARSRHGAASGIGKAFALPRHLSRETSGLTASRARAPRG